MQAADVDADATLGAQVVNARFWALVCRDEEWLRAEFDEIVGAAAERPPPPPVPAAAVAALNTRGRAQVGEGRGAAGSGGQSPARAAGWRRERSPPAGSGVGNPRPCRGR